MHSLYICFMCKKETKNYKGKKIYVNGGIVVMTPFFRYPNAGGLFDVLPEDCEQIECEDHIENGPCIIITETNAPSIFNEYYAKTFFTSYYLGAPFFYKTYDDCYSEYLNKIEDINELIKISNISPKVEQTLLRHVYMGIIAALDTFVCDTILTKITNSKESFFAYFQEFYLPKEKDKELKQSALKALWENNETSSIEQDVFDNVLETSYCRIRTIKKVYKKLFSATICDVGGKMRVHFTYRHLFAHRNGRQKNGEILELTRREIATLILDTNSFVKQIKDKLQ